MPIHHSIWKVGSTPTALPLTKLATEKELEDGITARPVILSPEWMLIGRQERTSFGGIVDLLAIAPDGSLVLIELKRDKTPRDKAFHEVGLFGNQNSVCQPVAASWRHTVERLKTVFPSWDAKRRKTDCPETETGVSL